MSAQKNAPIENSASGAHSLHTLLRRLRDEADICRNETADDVARLLDEAAAAIEEYICREPKVWRCESCGWTTGPCDQWESRRRHAEAVAAEGFSCSTFPIRVKLPNDKAQRLPPTGTL